MSMLCPKCHNLMAQYERNGVVVDQCTECKGIFLDRGELERLTAAEQVWHSGRYDDHPTGRHPADRRRHDDRHDDRHDRYDDHRGHDRRHRGHRRRSFLEDLFDFD